jgi:hypothetical protein
MKFLTLSPLILVLLSCGRASAPKTSPLPFVFGERIGWLQGGPCLGIANPNLKPGTLVALVVTGNPQTVAMSTIKGKTTSTEICNALKDERASQIDSKTVFYELDGGKDYSQITALGIVDPAIPPPVIDGLAKVDLNNDGHNEFFTSCVTAEGINFSVWPDAPYGGEPEWTNYYYMGYDLEPNCP